MDTSSMESDSGIARSLGYFPAVVYRWMQRRVRARVKSARILLTHDYRGRFGRTPDGRYGLFRGWSGSRGHSLELRE